MENPLKKIFSREAKSAPAMHSEPFSEFIGKARYEVQKAVTGRAAGSTELNWLRNEKNWDKPDAQKFKDGKWHFFFGAASSGNVPVAHWIETDGKFIFDDRWLGSDWNSVSRAVLKG